jgi:5-methylcytosine-specific restriction endonuclease McrA
MKTKRCTCCGETYPATTEYFYKGKKKKDGTPTLRSKCKECFSAYNQSDKQKEAMRKWRQSEKGKQTESAYWKSDRGKEVMKAYLQSEKGKETKRAYYKTETFKNNRRKSKQVRRARLNNVEVQSFTKKDLKMFWLSQNIVYDECYYCGKNMDGKYEHLDHYIPISKGGGHTMVNLRPSCACCNQKKSDKMPTDFPSQR